MNPVGRNLILCQVDGHHYHECIIKDEKGRSLTFIFSELLYRGPGLVVAVEGGVGRQCAVDAVCCGADAFLPQISHEEL